MRISDWSSDVCSSDLLDPVLRLAVQDRRQVTARPIQVRLHDLQREAGGDRRIEGIAAALEDGHADRRGDPVGRGDDPEGADDRRPRGKVQHDTVSAVVRYWVGSDLARGI